MGSLGVLWSFAAYAAYGVLSYCILLIGYRLTLHPLIKYPGPFLARFTDFYGGFHAARKSLHLVTYQNHQKYGKVFRQGPDRLVFNTVEALYDIYQNPRITKSSVFEISRATPKSSVFDTIDVEEHRRKRRIVSQPISERSMRTFEPTIMVQVDKFVDDLITSSLSSSPSDMTLQCRNLGGDIIGQLAFGYHLNLQSESQNRWLLSGLNLMAYRINIYMQIPLLIVFEPLLRFFLKRQRGRYLKIITTMIERRLGLEKHAKHDLYSFAADHMKGGLSLRDSELWSEAFFFLTAGGTTPSTALSALYFYLSRNSECYKKLATEIRSTFASPDEIRMGEKLQSCEYLRACINETLRIATPNNSFSWREELAANENGQRYESPLIVDGHVIPAGTLVGVSLYSIHHNEEYFPDPWVFKPERFLEAASEDARERAKITHKAFAPFAIGNRSCSGRALAYMELSLAIAKTLWHLDFEPAPGKLGLVGGGEEGRKDGRGRPDEYQLYDTFTSTHDGPYLVFSKRL